jgi:hypothetical protein
VVPQSGAKDQFYCTFYYKTLNSNYEAQREHKNLKKMSNIVSEAKINAWMFLVYFIYFLMRKLCLKVKNK